MKRFLLFCVAITSYLFTHSQTYNIPSTLADNIIHDEPSGYAISQVSGIVERGIKVTYNHNNPIFSVQTGWHTRFNDFSAGFGTPGNNADYFFFQGTNTISNSSGNAVIIFDTVYFNNGPHDMSITSYNSGFRGPLSSAGAPPGSIVITRKLEFNNKITTTNKTYPVNGAIVFSNSAIYTGGDDDDQHVNGFVSEVNYAANTTPTGHGGTFTFPVGNGTQTYPLTRVGNFSDYNHTLTVGWVDGDPGITADPTVEPGMPQFNSTEDFEGGSGLAAISRIGFWDWHYQHMSAGNFAPEAMPQSQTITVHIPSLEGQPVAASELRLVGWDPSLQWWVNLSGSTGATGLAKGSELTGVIPAGLAISALAIGSTNVALPVTFGTFKVTASGCKALINWQTSFEQNNNYFKVERSANGRDFVSIGQVASSGNNTSLKNYQFTDLTPLEGVNYYRITQVDFDGKQTSTDVNAIRIQCNGAPVSLKLFPNPAKQQVNVLTGKAVSQVNVLNAGGQSVLRYTPSVNQGGTFSLNISNIAGGVYMLQVINKDGTRDVIKFFKE